MDATWIIGCAFGVFALWFFDRALDPRSDYHWLNGRGNRLEREAFQREISRTAKPVNRREGK